MPAGQPILFPVYPLKLARVNVTRVGTSSAGNVKAEGRAAASILKLRSQPKTKGRGEAGHLSELIEIMGLLSGGRNLPAGAGTPPPPETW